MIEAGKRMVPGRGIDRVVPRDGVRAAGFLAVGVVTVLATGCGPMARPGSLVAHAGPDQREAMHSHGPATDGHAHGHDDHAHAGSADGAGKTTPPVDASQPTFRDAVAAIIDHDERIRAAFEADDPDAAHDDLHAIGHVLEDLPKLAGTAGFAIDRKAVERSAGVLFDAFSRIDDKLHGGTGSTYAEEAKTISKELGAFRAFLAEHRP
ncbi:MAG: hypothetical protein EBS51_13115 [Planctomycetia bacterium]|nr:hypothetical protein [Planctomycetia bacterium]